jgi:hypothetical protein
VREAISQGGYPVTFNSRNLIETYYSYNLGETEMRHITQSVVKCWIMFSGIFPIWSIFIFCFTFFHISDTHCTHGFYSSCKCCKFILIGCCVRPYCSYLLLLSLYCGNDRWNDTSEGFSVTIVPWLFYLFAVLFNVRPLPLQKPLSMQYHLQRRNPLCWKIIFRELRYFSGEPSSLVSLVSKAFSIKLVLDTRTLCKKILNNYG